MNYHKIVLAGGSGYLGTVLAKYYSSRAQQVVIVARKPAPPRQNISTMVWDAQSHGDWRQSLEGADLLINLCGKNVNCRYTEKNKEEILNSRIIPTQLLNDVIKKLKQPPALWINITSATIYRHAEDKPQDEATGETGYGFSIDVCRKWEQTFFSEALPATRKIALRMGIVLGRGDGAFPRLLNLVRTGLGGKQGDGKQFMSWIHEQDVARCTEWLMQQPSVSGVVNATAPEPIQNAGFMQLVRKAYGISLAIPSPQWLLEIGAWLLGTETELLLKSRWVIPARLQQQGFVFQYATAAHAIHDLLSIRN